MRVENLIDTALDRSVALGYANIGLHVRRRLPGWPAEPARMDGKVALVTGAASGIGLAAASGFAGLGRRCVRSAATKPAPLRLPPPSARGWPMRTYGQWRAM